MPIILQQYAVLYYMEKKQPLMNVQILVIRLRNIRC